jgi:hypothetical protein
VHALVGLVSHNEYSMHGHESFKTAIEVVKSEEAFYNYRKTWQSHGE